VDPAVNVGHPLVLALYHPRFHQIPENDGWHGPGFTEWGLVAGAVPRYPGHRQPQLPGELGFYDQRVAQTRQEQARLAEQHGISGFLYLHYWYGGHELFQQPLAEVLASGSPAFPFALCWANESWTRLQDAGRGEVLLGQSDDEADDVAHILSLIDYFKDPRYIKVHGRPLLFVMSAPLLADPERMVGQWKAECRRAGTEPPWLVMYEGGDGADDPTKFGFDATVEALPQFPAAGSEAITVVAYGDVVSAALSRPLPSWTSYPSLAPAWDSTPRHPAGGAVVWKDATPARYGQWLAAALDRQDRSEGAHGIVVIDAWNDWADGSHLEPDTHWGRAYLDATKEVVAHMTGTQPVPPALATSSPSPASVEALYADLFKRYGDLQASTTGLLSNAERRLDAASQQFAAALAESRAESNRLVEILTPIEGRLALERDRADALERLLAGRPPVPAVVRSSPDGAPPETGQARYFELLKACLTRMLFMNDEPGRDLRALAEQREIRMIGKDWPDDGETMIGMLRLDCIQQCVETVLREQVPGDFLEAGVWRGGATIFMKGILAAYGVQDRQVWVADSFRGLPVPDEVNFPQDVPIDQSVFEELAVSLEQVKANFARYDLLDDRVRFLEGWFKDTLPTAPVDALAVLRLDGDYYESTIQILESLYHKVSPGGFVIVDDYGCIEACREAVTDFRNANGIEDTIVKVDWTGVYWRRSA
jgi:Macrocin-O-methyltransferase (TylF)/Glycosyltransferase WbsX